VKNHTARCTLAVAVLCVMLFAGADWMQYRGPGAAGVSQDTGLPTTWSATENVVWKTALPGRGASSPITLGDKIFLTAYTGYGQDIEEPGETADLERHLLCIDRAGGKILWQKSAKALLPEEEFGRMMSLHGYASSTPATDGEAVYVFYGRSGARAYSLTGELLWTAQVGTGLDGWGSANSPILAGNLVIVNASIESESVVALNKKTGEEVWRAKDIKESWSTPTLVDVPGGKQELVVSMHSEVRGYDPATGQQLWTCDSVEDYVCPTVIAADGVVFITGGRGPLTVAVRAGGRGDVTDTHLLWDMRKTPKVPTPLIHDGLLYWVGHMGTIYCIDAVTGEEVYHARISQTGTVYASVVLADGKLYAVTRSRGTVVLAAGKEFKELARNDLGDESIFNATPVVSNGQLLLRSDSFLYCIGE